MENNFLSKAMKKIPLKTRLKVSTEMAFMDLIVELGYREDKGWTDEEDEKLQKLCDLASTLADHHIEEMNQWVKDGKPK
jgi:hypothetical protein